MPRGSARWRVGARDIRANDASQSTSARASASSWAQCYWIRFDIYKKKFLIKFINNFISQLGPVLLLRDRRLSGAPGADDHRRLAAVVGAQKDITRPGSELLTYYQSLYDVKIKYEQVVTQFDPPGLQDEPLQLDEPDRLPRCDGELRAIEPVVARRRRRARSWTALTFALKLPSQIAIVGPAGSGKEELTLVLAGLLEPAAGRVTIDDHDLSVLPEAVLGRRIGYVGNPTMIFAGRSRTTCSTA